MRTYSTSINSPIVMGMVMAVAVPACGTANVSKIVLEEVAHDQIPKSDLLEINCRRNGCINQECGPDGCGGECGQCGEGEECSDNGLCSPIDCSSSKDCPGLLVCSPESGQCVVCVGDEDCPDEMKCGADNECHENMACDSDIDCKPLGQICDKVAGLCVECLGPDTCEEEEYCSQGYCLPDNCPTGETKCEDNTVLVCLADGSAWVGSLHPQQGLGSFASH